MMYVASKVANFSKVQLQVGTCPTPVKKGGYGMVW